MEGCQDRDPRLALCLAPTGPNLAPHAVFLDSVSAQRWREESRGKEEVLRPAMWAGSPLSLWRATVVPVVTATERIARVLEFF